MMYLTAPLSATQLGDKWTVRCPSTGLEFEANEALVQGLKQNTLDIDTQNELAVLGLMTETSSRYKLQVDESGLKPSLDIVHLEVTWGCNFACKHCYVPGLKQFDDIPTDGWFNLIDQVLACGVTAVVVTGGEPLTRTDVFDLLQRLCDAGVEVLFFTNGMECTDEVAERLARMKIDMVSISLDSLDHDTYKYFRMVDGVDQTTTAIKSLAARGVPVRVVSVISEINVQELETIMDFCSDAGVAFWEIDPLAKWGVANDHPELWPVVRRWREIKRIVLGHEEELTLVGRPVPRNSFQTTGSRIDRWAEMSSSCGVGTSLCHIKPNGDVTLCPPLSTAEFVAGNAFGKPLSELWERGAPFQLLRGTTLADYAVCKKCEFNSVCLGGCRARAFASTGSLTGPDPWSCVTWKA